MFSGRAKEAIDFYVSLFSGSSIGPVSYYDANGPGAEGTVKHAVFYLNGQEFICIDSNAAHGFTFTPAISLSVKCQSDQEIESIFEKLADGGKVMMALGAYPFSPKFGWVADRFGVSWQLNLVIPAA